MLGYCCTCGGQLVLRELKPGEPMRRVCGACGRVHWDDPKVAAGVLIRHESGVVLLRRSIEPSRGRWVFPGGFVDRGEHPERAAVREALEEACVEVVLEGLQGVYHDPPGSPVVLIVYTGRIVSGVPQVGDESLEVQCIPLPQVPWSELAFPTTMLALRDYVERAGVAVP